MAVGGFKQLFSAFQEGGSFMDIFSGALMGLVTILPIATTLTSVFKKAKDSEKISTI
jgi:hypothetical protein